MRRSWDIENTNDPDVINAKLKEAPQLCQVLNKDIEPHVLFNLINDFYCYEVPLGDENRQVVLLGAYRGEGEIGENCEGVKETFGREASDYANIEIFDDLFHVDGVPYIPFSDDVDLDVIELMRPIFDVQDIAGRTCMLCMYLDINAIAEYEGRVVSQFQFNKDGTVVGV